MLGLLISFTVEQLSPQHLPVFEQMQAAVSGLAGLLAMLLAGQAAGVLSVVATLQRASCRAPYAVRRDCVLYSLLPDGTFLGPSR